MASRGSGPGLTSLAPELILRILDFTDPPSQVSLACAARHLAACCHHQFRRHQDAHARYAVSSDLDPATVPHLLRSALGLADPLDAWHVRSFEVWGAREFWDEWRPFSVDVKTESGLEDGEPLRWVFREGEVERLLGVFGGEMPDAVREFAEEGLRRGADWFLKAVMLALLPRLVDVKVVGGAGNKAIAWLAHAMAWSQKHDAPGFASVRSAAVNVCSGTWRDELSRRTYAQSLASILHLPCLETLYFSGLELGEEDIEDQDTSYANGHALLMGGHPFRGPHYDEPYWHVPDAGSIPLKRLTLDDIGDVNHDFRDALLSAPRALEAFSLRAEGEIYDVDNWPQAGHNQGDSLRRLMFYNPDRMHGYRCSAFYPEVLTEGLLGLTQACGAVNDVELQGMNEDFTETLREAFPRRTEVLVLFDHTGDHLEPQEEFPTQVLDDALAEVIRAKRRWYPRLRAVFLEQVEEATFRYAPGSRVCFPGAMAAGREMGVEVFTRTSGRGRARWGAEFLAPLGKYDLRTGPHWREGKAGMVLDFGRGEWVEDCGCCGRCESCLKVYTAEVWEGVLKEREERGESEEREERESDGSYESWESNVSYESYESDEGEDGEEREDDKEEEKTS